MDNLHPFLCKDTGNVLFLRQKIANCEFIFYFSYIFGCWH